MSKRLALAVNLVLLLSLLLIGVPVKAQTAGTIVINPYGSVTGTYSIQQVGNTYTLTSNISGNIKVEKSGVTIDGSGYSLDGGIDLTNGIGPNLPSPTRPEVTNVTVKNLYVNIGIGTNGGGNDTFYNDYFLSGNPNHGGAAISLIGCSNNNISYCTFENGSQISMDYSAAFNTVTQCNLPPYGIIIWLSGYETVDRNYWSDYSTKYPTATEVNNSGVGNQPYVYYSTQDTNPNGTNIPTIYQDNHPLIQPVNIPLMGSNSQTNIPEFPLPLIILPLLLSVLSIALLCRHRKVAHG